MTKRNYLHQLMSQPTDWLKASAANPTPHMSRMHVALHHIELRRRGRIASYYAGVAVSEGWA